MQACLTNPISWKSEWLYLKPFFEVNTFEESTKNTVFSGSWWSAVSSVAFPCQTEYLQKLAYLGKENITHKTDCPLSLIFFYWPPTDQNKTSYSPLQNTRLPDHQKCYHELTDYAVWRELLNTILLPRKTDTRQNQMKCVF